jgi:hypothetical protein
MNKTVIILLFLTLTASAHRKSCTSDTFQNIKSKSIAEMTDGEYRLFDDYYDHCFECDTCNLCNGKYLLEIKDKSIIKMNANEYDYFSEHFWNCDSIKPCELKQFNEMKDKKEIEMTNNELDFFKKCKDECESYQYHRSTKHKIKKSIFISGIILLFLSGLGYLFYDFTRPRGY